MASDHNAAITLEISNKKKLTYVWKLRIITPNNIYESN